jgi:endonuclease/exonuclease/phosphatase family metal-dependent hydrolase
MVRRRLVAFAWVVLFLPALGAAAEPLTVMSFNIRYGTAADGEHHWTLRRALLLDVLRQEDADLVGVQEALDFQIREITAALPAYAVVGAGRDDGKAGGEYSAILVRRDRFHVAEAGTFWFSDTPQVSGSTSWGNRITRICSWARLIDRDGLAFWIYNVHLDHESQPSRERSTALLAQHVHSRGASGEPVVITGDFNAGEDNPALASLVPGMFVDTYRVLHPKATDVATFNGFRPGPLTGPKIDYVLVQPGTAVLGAAIVRTMRDGRYPSDHFPVVARVRLRDPRAERE